MNKKTIYLLYVTITVLIGVFCYSKFDSFGQIPLTRKELPGAIMALIIIAVIIFGYDYLKNDYSNKNKKR